MSGETTNPNGSRKKEMNVKDTDDVIIKMRKSGYYVEVETLEFRPSDRELTITEMASYKDSENGSGNNSESSTNTSAPHIIDGVTGSVSFISKIPAIAQGPAASLKSDKDKNKKRIPTGKDSKTENDKTKDDNKDFDK